MPPAIAVVVSFATLLSMVATGCRRGVGGYRCRPWLSEPPAFLSVPPAFDVVVSFATSWCDGCNGLPIGLCRGWQSMPSAIDAVVYLILLY